MSNISPFLEQALALAESSVQNGNHPFGAVLVLDGKVVCQSENEVETRNDITAHAELRLIQKAQKILSKKELSRSVLYSSSEPCAMCAGAIYWAGIPEVVYGSSTEELCEVVNGGLSLSLQEILSHGSEKIRCSEKTKDPRFKALHQDFWPRFFSEKEQP